MRLNPFVDDKASAAPALREEIVITMYHAIMQLSVLIQFQTVFAFCAILLTQ